MPRPRLLKLALLLGLIFILIFLFHFLGWLAPLERGITNLLSPAGSYLNDLGLLARRLENGESVENVAERLEHITSERNRLIVENARLSEIERENEILREYVSFTRRAQFTYVMTGVVAQGSVGDNWRNRESVTLSRGSADGLVAGMPILSADGVLLGKLTNVGENLSEACLLVSPSCRLAVAISGTSETIGIAQGDLGLTVQIDFIPQNKEIQPDALIVTSGLEQYMPPGLVVGTVGQVFKQSNELWQKAVVNPIADFESLRVVLVMQ